MNKSTDETAKGHLLIIDDESELREVLMALLEDSTAKISVASDGVEGIDLLKSGNVHAMLSDEKMPKKTGLEVLRWMRANNIDIPFIMHSGYGKKELVAEAQQLGAYAFFDKPWDERSLIRTVEAAIKTGLKKTS